MLLQPQKAHQLSRYSMKMLKFSFLQITSAERTLVLRGQTEVDTQSWMSEIKLAIEQVR